MAKKPTDRKMVVNHGDNCGTSWMDTIHKLGEQEQENRKERIKGWARNTGPPHATVTLGDDPEYIDLIGFWKIPDGIFRILASKKGEFDPFEGVAISEQEIKAMMDAFEHPVIAENKL